MNLRPLPRSRLEGLIPALIQPHALVALVSSTDDERWAAATAWTVARSAAAAGRRVALIDLMLETPQLHAAAGLPLAAQGIADAFENGTDLTTHAHEVAGVYFVAAGKRTAAPEFVLAHPRWKKLQAGFRSEGALLLVYGSAAALSRMSAVPDGVIALAPEGLDVESPAGRGVAAAVADGAELIGVVRERWSAAAAAPATAPALPPTRRRSARALVGAGMVVLAIAVVGAVALLSRRGESAPPPAEPAAKAVVATKAAPAGRADTLAWVIQLAAYASAENAVAHADALAEAGLEPFVSAVATGPSGTVWYRVLVGQWPRREAASAAREQMWEDERVRPGEGDLLRAPLSFVLEGNPPPDVADLRRRGVPAVARAGRAPLVGAFETADQAAFTRDYLIRAGIAADLVLRVERPR